MALESWESTASHVGNGATLERPAVPRSRAPVATFQASEAYAPNDFDARRCAFSRTAGSGIHALQSSRNVLPVAGIIGDVFLPQ